MKNNILSIQNLYVSVDDQPILKGLSLNVEPSKVHVFMGPNGSGKSTLAHTLMGHPSYVVNSGAIFLEAKEITHVKPDKRAKGGLFLAFQYPPSIPGLTVLNFLKEAYHAVSGELLSMAEFMAIMNYFMEKLGIDESFAQRSFNEGFSGGEKKRLEMLQLLILQPKIAILDEIDSGLDVDALKIVGSALALARKTNPTMSILMITHYQRMLNYIVPDYVHVMAGGRIVRSGDKSVGHELDRRDIMGLSTDAYFTSKKGLNRSLVIEISERKNEPGWMTDFRLKALETFERMPMPTWGADLGALNQNDIHYYVRPLEEGTKHGKIFLELLKQPLNNWASLRQSKNIWPVLVRNMNQKSFIKV